MNKNIQTILNHFYFNGEITVLDDVSSLSSLSSNHIIVKYEASPKSSQTMIHKTILINENTNNQYEINPHSVNVTFKKDGTVEKSPSNLITAQTIFNEDPQFTHVIFIQDGTATLFDLTKLNKADEAQSEVEVVTVADIDSQSEESIPVADTSKSVKQSKTKKRK